MVDKVFEFRGGLSLLMLDRGWRSRFSRFAIILFAVLRNVTVVDGLDGTCAVESIV